MITGRDREFENRKFYNIPWRKCTLQDFTKKGMKILESNEQGFKKRFCPDVTPEAEKFYQLKNSYTNETKRISFEIVIHKCQVKPYVGINYCAPDY